MTDTDLDPTECMVAAEELLEETEDPLHRQILQNYRRHVLLEISGYVDEMFTDKMFNDKAHYKMTFGGEEVVLSDIGEIKDFYHEHEIVNIFQNETLQVDDGGIWSDATHNVYVTGEELVEEGVDADLDSYYIQRADHLMRWTYDNRGRLIEERVAQYGPAEFVEITEEEYYTPDDVRPILDPIIDPLPDLPTPS